MIKRAANLQSLSNQLANVNINRACSAGGVTEIRRSIFKRVSMGCSLLRLSINVFQLRLTKKSKINFSFFKELRANASRYRPDVCKSEKSKILKKIHKVAPGNINIIFTSIQYLF